MVSIGSPARCPADTVLLADAEPRSGAGAVPAGFDGRMILRCEVDHATMTDRDGVARFTVRQWSAAFTPEVRAALALPDRELRDPGAACGASAGVATVLYVVDAAHRAVRVIAPTDGPCDDVRADVMSLLPDDSTPARQTFTVQSRDG